MKELRHTMIICLIIMTTLGLFMTDCGSNSSIVKGNSYRVSNVNMGAGKYTILPFKSASEGKTMTNRVSTDGNAIADILTIQMLYKNYTVLERDVDELPGRSALSGPVEHHQGSPVAGKVVVGSRRY